MSAAIQLFTGDDDMLADLRERGVELAAPMADSQLDALASEYMGEMADCDREVARYTEARDAELRRVAMKYDALMLPHIVRRGRFEQFVKELAERADFGPKKKSRDVGNGTYGRRSKPEHVTILDKDKAVDFARAHFPTAVKEKTTYTVEQKSIQPVVIAYMKAHEGELPDGFEHTAERDEPFCKVEVD